MSWRRHVPSLRIHDSCWKSHTFHMHVAWNKESIQGSTYSWVNRFTTGRCRLLQMGLPDSKTCLAANVISARRPACAGMCSNLRFWIHGKVMYPACICMCMHACMHACDLGHAGYGSWPGQLVRWYGWNNPNIMGST